MAIEILMPALSPTMEEGTLAKWLVKEGDEVSSGDLLAEIETDKATMEFEAIDDGVIGKILVAEGSAGVQVNTPIAVLLAEGEPADAALASGGATSSPTPEGATSSAASTAPQTSGFDAPDGPAASATDHMSAPASAGARVFASPLARRLAKDRGIDLTTLTGSGPRGRIVKADILAWSPSNHADIAEPSTPSTSETPPRRDAKQADPSASADAILKLYADRDFETVPLDGMRKTIAARLSDAKQTIPHFYLRQSIKLDDLLAFRATLNAQLAARSVKLSVNDFIIKACALALQEVPDANAVWAGDRILRLAPSDVAVAVAIDGGLFTPVLRDAHLKSLSALSTEMKDLASRARDRKLAPRDYQGGSFAISNLGMFGIDNFDAVINPPHGSILAVGAGVKQPIVGADHQVTVATLMSVTLSVDHRVIDGALGAQFLAAIKAHLENPIAMLA